ncbi:MAG TPA: peptide chain release factor N(5)-glutamine methyltransferase [Chitinophagaceae bacterium]
MKMQEAEQWLRKELLPLYGEGEATAMTNMIMEHLTGLERPARLQKKDEPLNVHQLHHLTEINQRIQRHEPVQYIIGETWFAGMKLYVDKNVLIPRPETEELVQWIVQDVKTAGIDVFQKKEDEADLTTTLKILDVGTGSGCIALALKKQMPKAEVWGCDISEEALNVARRNGSDLDIRVDFQGVDFLDRDQQKFLPTADIIVSNPPYVPAKDRESMHHNVKDHEPSLALFVSDDDPLVFYKALAEFGKHRLHNNGSIYCEVYENLGDEVVQLFRYQGYNPIEMRKDMQGKNRMVKAVYNNPG